MTIAHIHLIYFIPLWKMMNSPVFDNPIKGYGLIASGGRKEIFLGWPIAPSYMSPNAGVGCGVSND